MEFVSKKTIFQFAGVVLFLIGTIAHGAIKKGASLGLRPEKISRIKKSTGLKGQITIERTEFFRSNEKFFREGIEESENSVEINMAYLASLGKIDFKIDFMSRFNKNEDYTYLQIRDFYLQGGKSSWSVTGGRKRQNWSRADEFWQRGFWQPRTSHNGLYKESLGLTGIFVENRSRDAQILFFLSPFYLPEMVPYGNEIEGRFISSNPWFKPPPDQLKFKKDLLDVNYHLRKPEVRSVLNNPSIAMRVALQEKFFWAALAYAYKPENQFYQSFNVQWIIHEGGSRSDFLQVEVIPEVRYHHLASFESGLNGEVWHPWYSFIYHSPTRKDIGAAIISQETKDTFNFTVYSGWDLFHSKIKQDNFYFSLSQVWGGQDADRGELSGDTSYFNDRIEYYQAMRIGFKYPLLNSFADRINTRFEFTHDFAQRAAVFTSGFDLKINKSLAFLLEVNILGVVDEAKVEKEEGFVRNFRANDNVVAGMSYVF